MIIFFGYLEVAMGSRLRIAGYVTSFKDTFVEVPYPIDLIGLSAVVNAESDYSAQASWHQYNNQAIPSLHPTLMTRREIESPFLPFLVRDIYASINLKIIRKPASGMKAIRPMTSTEPKRMHPREHVRLRLPPADWHSMFSRLAQHGARARHAFHAKE